MELSNSGIRQEGHEATGCLKQRGGCGRGAGEVMGRWNAAVRFTETRGANEVGKNILNTGKYPSKNKN